MALMQKSTNTVIGMMNDFRQKFGLPLDPDMDTTLNSKYGIQAAVVPTTYPVIKYVGIGIGGFYNVGTEGLANTYNPLADNQDLYHPIPWRIRPLDEDLSAAARADYRMRRVLTIEGTQYVAYYLKPLVFPTSAVTTLYVNADGSTEEYNVVSNLTPTGIQLADEDDATADDRPKIIVSCEAQFTISAEEIEEAVSVLFDGDDRYGKISEFGIYSGLDQAGTVGATSTGTTTYTEAIYAQLAVHYCNQGNSDFTSSTQKFILGNGNLYLL